MRSTPWITASVLALILGPVPLSAQQTGTIVGSVLDATSQRPLQSAQLFIPGTSVGAVTSEAGFRGLPNGLLPAQVEGGSTVNDYSTIGPALLAADAPSVLMSYAEVLFLGAEAAARGWIAADPAELYRQGIEASMKEYGVPQGAIDAYLAEPSVAYTGTRDILLQQWITVYLQGPEAFNEVRRTGVPDLPLPGRAVIDQLPARLPYPPNEALFNSNAVPFLEIDYTEPVWWM